MQLKTETKVGLFVLISIAIFGYMAVHLGVFRFYLREYKPYFVYFRGLDGIEKKSDVKIAGVKVGWVDKISLQQDNHKAKVKIMVKSEYPLYSDATVDIHQDGLLGTKYLDINPGMSDTLLSPGSEFGSIVPEKASVDDIMKKFERIASNIQDVSESLKGALGGNEQQNQLKYIIENINEASKKIAMFTNALAKNENNLDAIFNDLKNFSRDIAPIGKDINRVANVFDKNFTQLAANLDSTMNSMKSVIEKIDNGKGLLGKLVNEDEIYQDLKVVASEFREMADLAEKTGVVVDAHSESMARHAEHYNHPESKGYLDLRLHTNEDTFYLLQLVGTEKGSLSRRNELVSFVDCNNRPLGLEQIRQLPNSFALPYFREDKIIQTRNTIKFGLQIGKIYKDLALRFGIFENFAGVAIDYEIPFCKDRLRWITTLEAFDFRGQERINDRNPHLKWINRVFFMNNLYFDFGADDFVSKHNANAFFGIGVRFNDDEIKHLLAKLGFLVPFVGGGGR